jgi:hypothetical protein
MQADVQHLFSQEDSGAAAACTHHELGKDALIEAIAASSDEPKTKATIKKERKNDKNR